MESRFNYSREIDSTGEFYRQVVDFLTQEVQSSPERLEEISHFQRYISQMQQLVPWQASFVEQAQTSFALTRALEIPLFPSMPVVPPHPGRVITAGEHMSVTVAQAGECWPDNSRRSLQLDDGKVIQPKTPTGRIDIVKNFTRLDPDTSVIDFTRQLISSSVGSLRELALLIEGGEPRIGGVEVFGGTSHLARMGKRFGFTVFDIKNKEDREMATKISKRVASGISGKSKAWEELAKNYKPAKVAFISKQKLVSLFGSQGPTNIRAATTR